MQIRIAIAEFRKTKPRKTSRKISISPPRPKGPPLNALRAFEAAARLGGFLAAADELSVTPGAVSQHIRTVEAWAGAPLFERRAQGVALTAQGAKVAQAFTRAFDEMGAAVRALRELSTRQAISIAALPSVAQLWLSPRMPGIRAALPGCDLSIVALETRPNLAREMFDLSLFLDAPTGRHTEIVLRQDSLYPVCSAQIADKLHRPDDLRNQTWLSDASWPQDWATWLAQAAPGLARPQTGPSHSLYSLAVAEAQNGAGVLIGHDVLIGGQVARGDLVAPFRRPVPSGLSLNLELAGTAPPSGPLSHLVELLTEFAKDQDLRS